MNFEKFDEPNICFNLYKSRLLIRGDRSNDELLPPILRLLNFPVLMSSELQKLNLRLIFFRFRQKKKKKTMFHTNRTSECCSGTYKLIFSGT